MAAGDRVPNNMHARPPRRTSEGAPSLLHSSQPAPRHKASKTLASFAAFRSPTDGYQSPTASPIRRKPLPADSPVVGPSSPPGTRHRSISSLGSRLSYQRSSPARDARSSPYGAYYPPAEDQYAARNSEEDPNGRSPLTAHPLRHTYAPPRKSSLSYEYSRIPVAVTPRHDRSASGILKPPSNKASHARSPTMPNMPLYAAQPQPASLKLQLQGVTEDFIDEYPYDASPDAAPNSKPKSPAAGKFTSFFGWNKAQNEADSPSTAFSEKSVSPSASPRYSKPVAKNKPSGLDIPGANSFAQASYFNVPGTPLLSSSPQMNAHVEELERELRELSSELASSIRRELELEDEVERWKAETTLSVSDNRRTSDYYSDSGASSVRYPISDVDSKLDEVEGLRRKAEQERAQLKVRMAERLQEELRRRRDLEEQVQQLEERVHAHAASSNDRERIRELEATLEDVKRRLAEEKQVRENFEDLLAALRQDLEQYRNERDNLRDEVVPSLKARVDGLESQAADTQDLVYETTRMQQEIQQLQRDNRDLEEDIEQLRFQNQSVPSLQQEVEQLRVKTQHVPALEQEVQQLRIKTQTVPALEQEVEQLRIQTQVVPALEQEIEELRYENQSLPSLHQEVEQLRVKTQIVPALEQEIEELRYENQSLPSLHQEIEQLRTENQGVSELQDQVHHLQQENQSFAGLQQEIHHLRAENHNYKRLQQELQQLQAENQNLLHTQQQLQNENQTLANEKRMQQDFAQRPSRIQSIYEEADVPQPLPKVGLSRSNSLARNAAFNPKRGSLSRSNSVKNRSVPESPQDGPPNPGHNPVKDLEEQRDALHKALKHLLQRQELQQKEFEKRIKELEAERDKALNLTPRRTTFHKEVAHLRDEVNSLRRRADDALEQKWQCEKGLGGLRMDLDRAQQETTSLRELLQEHDIEIPEIRIDDQPISLDKAYQELRTTHALSIARIKQMESDDSLGEAGDEAERTLELLKRSISDAEAEREAAQKEAEEYRQQARALQHSELLHLSTEAKLSKELFAAATRMDELSNRIQIQLQSNRDLRVRLASAIARGEKEQTKSTETIIELERRLQSAEDKVMVAQQSSEEAISRHEEEVQALKESQGSHLRRVKSGLLSPAAFSPKLPASPFSQRFPRIEQTSSGPAMSIAEATKTELLEKRVEELERALRDADHEMEEVVGRMNMAQIEVADLQFERDEAMKKTRKLQSDILAEREKVKALMAAN